MSDSTPVRHWWNGELRRRARRDLLLHEHDGRYTIEDRTGGKDGRSRWSRLMSAEDAEALAGELQQGESGWREIPVGRSTPL